MKLIWLPTWRCTNYSADGSGDNQACPYCPLGFRGGRLTVGGLEQAHQGDLAPEVAWDFFVRSRHVFTEGVSLSGGEPLVYPHLRPSLEHLTRAGWAWAITSNMMATRGLERLEGLNFSRCLAWTCSYHPFANRDQRFAENVFRLASFGIPWIYVTIVITQQTVDLIKLAIPWLEKLPVTRFNVQWDIYHREARPDFQVPDNPRWLVVEETKRESFGVDCRSRSRSLVLSPSGDVFECVAKSYRGRDPLGHCSTLDVASVVDDKPRWCGLRCSLPCDVTKWA